MLLGILRIGAILMVGYQARQIAQELTLIRVGLGVLRDHEIEALEAEEKAFEDELEAAAAAELFTRFPQQEEEDEGKPIIH